MPALPRHEREGCHPGGAGLGFHQLTRRDRGAKFVRAVHGAPGAFYEGSGTLLDLSFARVPVEKNQLFLSNAVHCHPRANRASHMYEIANCSAYLHRELEIARPRLVIGLGDDAERVLKFLYPTARRVEWPFSPPRNVRSKTVPCLHFAAHPAWIKRKHNAALEETYVQSLAEALKWAISTGSLVAGAPPPTTPPQR